MEAAIDSRIHVEFASDKGDVFLEMVWNLHQSVDKSFKAFLVHRFLCTTGSGEKISVLLLQLCAAQSDEANLDTENWNGSFSLRIKNGEQPIESQVGLKI